MPDPQLRAADTDREAVATALGQHMAAGRLTLAEYDDRVARAWSARTYGDLEELTADLPAPEPPAAGRGQEAAPTPFLPGTMVCGRPRHSTGLPPAVPWGGHGSAQHSWRAWLATSVTVLVIYLAISLASRDFSYFWPMWVIGPWGVALLASRVAGAGRVDADRRG